MRHLYTVILYGTDSDGDPDLYICHVRTKVAGYDAAVDAAKKQVKREGIDRDGERFHGRYPIVYAGRLRCESVSAT